tara:strand:+ start:1838 stop:2440 length:603 start_codon:yes stop_codon:yes gene_type:complete
MIDKKSYIQILLLVLILLIITFVYIDYFKSSKENLSKNKKNNTNKELVKSSDDLISDMSYFSVDNKGNRYEIFSEYGILNPDKSNLIFMEQVNAVVYLSNGERVLISSDKAKYNDDNNDTTFSGSVKMIYGEHEVNSEHLDLFFNNQSASLYDNVEYKSNLSELNADKILIDFLNKNTKIQMNDEKNNILVRSLISSGNN